LRVEIGEGAWPIFKIEVSRVEIEDGARDVRSISDETLVAGVDLEEKGEFDKEMRGVRVKDDEMIRGRRSKDSRRCTVRGLGWSLGDQTKAGVEAHERGGGTL
jgi:hypothetical protein